MNAKVSAGDLCLRYASGGKGRIAWDKDRPRSTDLAALRPPAPRGTDDVANGENPLNRFDGLRLVSLNPSCNHLLPLLLLLFVFTSSSLSVSHLRARTSAPGRLALRVVRVKDCSSPFSPPPSAPLAITRNAPCGKRRVPMLKGKVSG